MSSINAAHKASNFKGSIDLIGLFLLLPSPLFWAGNFIVGRAMHGIVPPMALSLWRWVIALALVLPFAMSPMRRDLSKYWQHRWRVLSISLAGVFAFNALVYIGLQSTTASNALLLNSFIPILVVLIGAVFLGQRIRHVQALGLVLSFVGVLTIIMHGQWSRLASLSFSRGDLIVFCAMISWALYTLWLRGIPAEIDRVGLIGTQIVIALFVLVPLYLWERASGSTVTWNLHSIGALAYLGVFPSFVAYLLYNIAVARVGAAQAGISIHLIPLFGVLLAVIFLGETIHGYHAIGIAAIITGIVLASVSTGSRKSSADAVPHGD
ncbi:DMT family transporter [Gluconobacter kondonii]|uniref:DMT family transporter n=1 Tax=Gluconobacter kondonii TaxID=941463 RepID=UPI001B8BED16|nr:DMT family transporter [Gluconobacter kondonii]MBS1066708.1 DMT family transporter [Gluconobacter kondonii]